MGHVLGYDWHRTTRHMGVVHDVSGGGRSGTARWVERTLHQDVARVSDAYRKVAYAVPDDGLEDEYRCVFWFDN